MKPDKYKVDRYELDEKNGGMRFYHKGDYVEYGDYRNMAEEKDMEIQALTDQLANKEMEISHLVDDITQLERSARMDY